MLRIGLVVDDRASTEGIVHRLVDRGAVLAETPFRNVGAGQTEAVEAYELHTPAIVVQLYPSPATLATSSAVHLMIGVASTEQDSLAIDVCLDGTIPPTQLTTCIDTLWDDRLVPFEANLRLGKRAPRRQKPVLFDPDPTWPLKRSD